LAKYVSYLVFTSSMGPMTMGSDNLQVFKVLWSEPTGTDGKESKEMQGGTLVSERQTKFGQTFTRKVRRFTVIDNRKGHCICL